MLQTDGLFFVFTGLESACMAPLLVKVIAGRAGYLILSQQWVASNPQNNPVCSELWISINKSKWDWQVAPTLSSL